MLISLKYIKIFKGTPTCFECVCTSLKLLNISKFKKFKEHCTVQSNALHHKGHHVHLLHVLLPQHRNWSSGF